MTEKRMFFLILVIVSYVLPLAVHARETKKPGSENPEAQEWVDMAWSSLEYEMNIDQIDRAIECLEKAVALDPGNQEILVELSDEYYQRGNRMPRGSDAEYDARNVYFKKGLESAREALEIKEAAGAHYWIAVNLAAGSENKSIIRRASIFPKLNKHMDWVEQNDRNYKYGAVVRFWSRVVTSVPGVLIKMVGEDPDRIFHELEEAIRIEPRFLDNYVYKAEFYYHMGRKKEALDVLDQILGMDPEAFPQERAYNLYAQSKGRANWKAWTGKPYPNR